MSIDIEAMIKPWNSRVKPWVVGGHVLVHEGRIYYKYITFGWGLLFQETKKNCRYKLNTEKGETNLVPRSPSGKQHAHSSTIKKYI